MKPEKRPPFYGVWCAMLNRCTNPNSADYPRYGGRGIRIQWLSFAEFKADMYQSYLRHKAGHSSTTIERVDNDGNYSRENCRWATRAEQAKNKSKHYTWKAGTPPFTGKTHTKKIRRQLSNKSKAAWERGDFDSRVNGMLGKEPWNKGKPFSAESRAKMSAAAKRRYEKERKNDLFKR